MSAVMNTIYNNYLSTYAPKSLTRYDTHKKSELRSVYNSIVQMNKESPWYLPTTNKTTQQYAVDIKENARDLHNTIAQLGGLEDSGILTKRRASSSNENIATATYVGPENTDDVVPQFSLEVQKLASGQENMGLFLADEKANLPEDTYSFDVGINGMNYEFQFSIGEAETNRDVQERLVRLINNANIGLKASLLEEDSHTSLRLSSESSGLSDGEDLIFSVSDDRTSKRSGAVEYFGLDYVSKTPSNAEFLINGEEGFSNTNRFTVGKMFEVELQGISPDGEPAEIGLKPDLESLTDNIKQLIGGYNSFVKAASAYLDSQSRSHRLVQEMKGIASLYEQSFSAMGFHIQDDGTMDVDAAQLSNAAAGSEDLSETFGYVKDFSNMLLRKSNQVSLNPMNYVDKVVVAYKNPGHNFVSPYTSSAYTGMMFNSYC
ncbi:MAG: hypothetical protein K6G30_09400 [Acetatifactor sp.]|nr:hypothetical protein [Acetatifactor sp.]